MRRFSDFSLNDLGKVAHEPRRPTRPERIPVSIAWGNWEYCCSPPTPPAGWDASPSQGYPPAVCRWYPLYTPGWRETMWGKVSCLRKQHDGKDWASNHRPSDLRSNALTTTSPHPPNTWHNSKELWHNITVHDITQRVMSCIFSITYFSWSCGSVFFLPWSAYSIRSFFPVSRSAKSCATCSTLSCLNSTNFTSSPCNFRKADTCRSFCSKKDDFVSAWKIPNLILTH